MSYVYNPETDEYEETQECMSCHRSLPSSGYDLCDDCEYVIQEANKEMSPFAREEKNFHCSECYQPIFLPGLCAHCKDVYDKKDEEEFRFRENE